MVRAALLISFVCFLLLLIIANGSIVLDVVSKREACLHCQNPIHNKAAPNSGLGPKQSPKPKGGPKPALKPKGGPKPAPKPKG